MFPVSIETGEPPSSPYVRRTETGAGFREFLAKTGYIDAPEFSRLVQRSGGEATACYVFPVSSRRERPSYRSRGKHVRPPTEAVGHSTWASPDQRYRVPRSFGRRIPCWTHPKWPIEASATVILIRPAGQSTANPKPARLSSLYKYGLRAPN